MSRLMAPMPGATSCARRPWGRRGFSCLAHRLGDLQLRICTSATPCAPG